APAREGSREIPQHGTRSHPGSLRAILQRQQLVARGFCPLLRIATASWRGHMEYLVERASSPRAGGDRKSTRRVEARTPDLTHHPILFFRAVARGTVCEQ